MKTSRISTPSLTAMTLVLGLGLLLILAASLSGGSVSAAANAAPVTANLPEPESNSPASTAAKADRQLTLKERISYQRAIEAVYWRHRIWPTANLKPKPQLEAVMPLAQIQAKVEDFLRKSKALEAYLRRPITGEQLQAEIDRIASQTQQPAMLAELWAALDNDPLVIAECLARPVLVERLLRERNAVPGRSLVANPAKAITSLPPGAVTKTATKVMYRLPAIAQTTTSASTVVGGAWTASNTWSAISTTNSPAIRANDTAVWTGAEMIVWGGVTFSDAFVLNTALNTGGRYDPATNSWTATSLTNAPGPRFLHTAVGRAQA